MDDRPERLNRNDDTTDREVDARTREIRSEIERTRDDLSETVDAIQEKLRPGNVVASAASATSRRVKSMANNVADTAEEWWDSSGGYGFAERVKNNPLPAAMAGVGLAWLMFANGRSRERAGYGQPRLYQGAPHSSDESLDRSSEWRSVRSSGPRRRMPDPGRAMNRGLNQVESMVRQYPLAVGAAAVIIGASLGLAVPETERENELMGEARDATVQRAQEVASTTVERVKDAAVDAATRAATGQ